jgi:ubiquinone biosynthesis protein
MDILKTGIGLSKTIKNVGRLREIINVFARNGFEEFILKTNIHSKIPGFVIPKKRLFEALQEQPKELDFWQSFGFRLRKSFEELGPSFIKMGQLLATREDLLDQSLIKELKLLQNKVQGITFSEARGILEKNLKSSFEQTFNFVDEKPIGTASIGMVYRGQLKTGENVVIKIRRPNIKQIITNDFEIIAFIVTQLDKVSNDFKYLGVSRAIDDFFKSIQLEMNFLIEAQNAEKLAKNISEIDKEGIFKIPKVYTEFSSDEVLVMEFIQGKPFNEISNLAAENSNLEYKLQKSVKMFTHTLLADGFFHADLHGGNFFLMPDGKIGLIDFGLMGSLSKKNRTSLVAILLALVTNNFENLVYEFLDVADYEVIPDHEVLVRDIQDALTPYIGLSVQQTDVTMLVHSIVTTLSKHQMYLPREWFIIFRALMTLDGLGKSINIDLNIFEVIDSEIHGIMSELVSKESMLEDAMWISRDVLSSVRIIPRHIKWVLREFAKRKYKIDIELSGFQKEIGSVSRSLNFLGLMFLASTMSFCGVYLVKDIKILSYEDIPFIVWIFWSIAAATIFRASIFIRK